MFEQRVEAAFIGLGVSAPGLLRPRELTRSMQELAKVKGLTAWSEYATAAEIHRQLAAPTAETDKRQLDGWAQCSARVGAALSVTPGLADSIMRRALALRDRLPQVNDALRAGRVAPHHISDIVSRTDLVDAMPWSGAVDAEIAEMLWRDGAWSSDRMRNMVDQIVFRHDPEGVRERRARANDGRSFKRYPTTDGMADIVASMTAENALLLDTRVQELASGVCALDPRTTPQRLSDAMFSATMDVEFLCDCGDTQGCAFARSDETDDDAEGTHFVVHVVMDQATVEGRANNPALLDGHGIIGGDHAREIARRPDATVRPLGGDLDKDALTRPSIVPDSAADDLHTPTPTQTNAAEQLDLIKRLVTAKEDAKRTPKTETDASAATAAADEPVDDESGGATPIPEPQKPSEAKRKVGLTNPPVDDDHAPEEKCPEISTDTADSDPTEPEPSPQPDRPRLNRAQRRRRRRKKKKALPTSQPADNYRLSAALNRFIRIRDAYCTFPGCRRPAWKTEIDHTDEYDHDNPTAGGQTRPDHTKCLCKFHHLLKTFGNWIDLQHTDANGRTHIIFISPEGHRFHGPAWTGDDLFPALREMTWREPGPPRTAPPDKPTRRRTRLADKYNRRRAERERNHHLIHTPQPPPPEPAPPTDYDGPPPPF